MANTSAEDLLRTARELFAVDGYQATSIGHIAEAAGLSKSAVLYHFASKEALLEAVLAPAEAGLLHVVHRFPQASGGDRSGFVEPFVDFLLTHRQEASIFINQGQSLHGIPVVDRANSLVQKLALAVSSGFDRTADRVRFGVALGGAAYILAAQENWAQPEGIPENDDEIRAALVDVVATLLTTTSAGLAAARVD